MALQHLVNTLASNAVSVKTFELYRIHELFVAVLREKKKEKSLSNYCKSYELQMCAIQCIPDFRSSYEENGRGEKTEGEWFFSNFRENKAIPVIARYKTILEENRIELFVCREGEKIEIAD